MKLKKDIGIHAFYKFISNLLTIDIGEIKIHVLVEI